MDILKFTSEYPYGANTYVISSNGEYAIIDPATSPHKILKALDISAKDFRYIILTHGHFDHILFIDEWHNLTNLSITVSEADEIMLKDSLLNCYEVFFGLKKTYNGKTATVKDGDELQLGNTTLKIHTSPGHTPGSILIEEGNNLFVGDTVFANQGYGRCDLPGGDFEKLKSSVRKMSDFDPNTVIYPGHGEETKISKIVRF